MMMKTLRRSLLLAALTLSALPALGGTIFVDNLHGHDALDGRTDRPSGQLSGPVRSLRRALQLAGHGDTISLRANPEPYFEVIGLTGWKHSGDVGNPFRILGNGATVSGAQLISAKAWRSVGANLWRVEPYRKGHFMLLLDGRPLPFHQTAVRAGLPDDLPDGNWTVVGARIFYKAAPGTHPATMPLALAEKSVGLTAYGVRHVLVQDVTFQHFRLDGVNAHDQCDDVLLQGVSCVENARSGVAVNGTSHIALQACTMRGNLEDSVRIDEAGQADVSESNLDAPARVIE